MIIVCRSSCPDLSHSGYDPSHDHLDSGGRWRAHVTPPPNTNPSFDPVPDCLVLVTADVLQCGGGGLGHISCDQQECDTSSYKHPQSV